MVAANDATIPTEMERMMAMHDDEMGKADGRPPLEMALDSLDRSQSALADLIEAMTLKLTPVLRAEETDKTVPGGSDIRGSVSPAVDRIYGAQAQAEFQAMRIRNLMDRMVV